MKIINVVGVRPNFIKVGALHRAFLHNKDVESKIVHTGQHFDAKMSEVFFEQLELPQPDYYLGINGGSHSVQTAQMMMAFESVLLDEKPDVVLVVGDVNSTVACALVAAKEQVPLVHVEAGLRSGDRTMPEEINRILIDSVSNLFFTTESSATENLLREGISKEKIHFVGNVMIDSLVRYRQKAQELHVGKQFGLKSGEYVLVTMHRPDNVDSEVGLKGVLTMLASIAERQKVIFSMHPRTRLSLQRLGLLLRLTAMEGVVLVEPQGYLEFLSLMLDARLVITDSGGIQEETTFLQIPCITYRSSTERPVTVALGTNYLASDLSPQTVLGLVDEIVAGNAKKGSIPPLWDGHAAGRIAAVVLETYRKPS
ncbi:non-hydrolyzing UDP-N-acetylglucosamine 2-epimerase [Dyadobacter jejuensis]|uniref:non-hydrolyzing UDP-N-acetylglucosamine 2-epimerase n=1 Tax=Dyadobacter jejuensis TaxID=1082580 RepID=UPI000D6A9F8C|nr:UDP-N-acetylglucosamine 2-epimerase (non-hydrolyzing) [Dyadobacter jejuensis]